MKGILKLLLVAFGFFGSISYNSGSQGEYLEEDELFSKTPAEQSTGWEWGLSSAHASLYCLFEDGFPCTNPGHGNTDDYADDEYIDYLWEQYDACMEDAQSPSEVAACEAIVAGLP